MARFPKKLRLKLIDRDKENALRDLPIPNTLVDFSSNDYLGLSKNQKIFDSTSELLKNGGFDQNGATGSRLLSGNHSLYGQLENVLKEFHEVTSALVFNSGYDANIGFFGSVPQRGDVVFYDEYIHASIRDGIIMGNAKSYKFRHNDLEDLAQKCNALGTRNPTHGEIYVVTESIFSMDGDSPDLNTLVKYCRVNDFHLVIDEAHAVGVVGEKGKGLVQKLGLQDHIFARIVTFGKAMGCHGAAILGSESLRNYLINFARSFIYTTALPPHSIATIIQVYRHLGSVPDSQQRLSGNIKFFKEQISILNLDTRFIPSNSAIQCCKIPGNGNVKKVAQVFHEKGFHVKAILSPTVSRNEERLRFCLHEYNTPDEIKEVLGILHSNV